jgi:hypothetical protein
LLLSLLVFYSPGDFVLSQQPLYHNLFTLKKMADASERESKVSISIMPVPGACLV